MVDRFYGMNYAEDVEGTGTGGAGGNIANGVATQSKDIEVRLNLGAGGTGTVQYVHLKTQRAAVLAKLQQIVDELECGKLPWPPPLS